MALSIDCQLSKPGLADKLGFLDDAKLGLVVETTGFLAALREGGVVDFEGAIDGDAAGIDLLLLLLLLLSKISIEDMAGLG